MSECPPERLANLHAYTNTKQSSIRTSKQCTEAAANTKTTKQNTYQMTCASPSAVTVLVFVRRSVHVASVHANLQAYKNTNEINIRMSKQLNASQNTQRTESTITVPSLVLVLTLSLSASSALILRNASLVQFPPTDPLSRLPPSL